MLYNLCTLSGFILLIYPVFKVWLFRIYIMSAFLYCSCTAKYKSLANKVGKDFLNQSIYLFICKPGRNNWIYPHSKNANIISLNMQPYICQECYIKQEYLCKYILLSLFISSSYVIFLNIFAFLINTWKNSISYACIQMYTWIHLNVL